jgi:uroporphyrinogen-III synthase
LRADIVPERNDATGMAAALLADGAGARGDRVLLPRAADGRDEAVLALRQAGVVVDVVTVYRTETTPAGDPALAHGLSCLRDGSIDVMAFFAPSPVQALFDIATASGIDPIEAARRCRVIAASGNTTRAALEDRGVPVHVVPETADAGALADAIADYYHGQAARTASR